MRKTANIADGTPGFARQAIIRRIEARFLEGTGPFGGRRGRKEQGQTASIRAAGSIIESGHEEKTEILG